MLALEKVKAQCRIDSDYRGEDDLLTGYIRAAHRFVENFTRRKLMEKLYDNNPPDFCEGAPLLFDADIETAMLLLIGHWYANREAVVIGESATTMPLAVEELLQPYKVYGL
ncbi:head-tail connector protein [Arsenophonus nasoniae]|uniref:Head-tail connector protein n=1 Tax=Arsenophonus nasoniae TaxID=638 RepID=A0AA95GJD5_9GAMM|nr:head-tail connector protein [Arsenophonus nasoniae]MDR5611525.1 head-tail connector protein [Arsenophonus sp.]WGM00027.1 head-tail connector protein [Arsenophonus nasoniae]